jgi:hypothetical protein
MDLAADRLKITKKGIPGHFRKCRCQDKFFKKIKRENNIKRGGIT